MTTYDLPQLPSPRAYDIAEKSKFTLQYLADNVKVGFTNERGPAWWANEATKKDGRWVGMPDGSHFDGPVPLEVVTKLLDVKLVKGIANVVYEDENGERQVAVDESVSPIVNATTGKVFSYPTTKYTIHPYLETLHGFIQKIQHDEEVAVGSAGLLSNGGVAFLQARLPKTFEVGGYGYQPYLTAVTSADLSRATSWLTGALGAVCDNTVDSAVLGAASIMKVRHTRRSLPAVQQIRDKLGLHLVQVGEQIGEAIDELLQVPVSDKELQQWLDVIAAVPEKDPNSKTGGRSYTLAVNKREGLEALWNHDPKVKPWAGTAFGGLQLVNTYRTWEQTVRGADGGRFERNLSNDMFGLAAKADTQAMEALAGVKGLL